MNIFYVQIKSVFPDFMSILLSGVDSKMVAVTVKLKTKRISQNKIQT